jgi:hypothetical protein
MKLLNFLIRNKPKVDDIYLLKGTEDHFCFVNKVEGGMVTMSLIYKNPAKDFIKTNINYYVIPNDKNQRVLSIFDFCELYSGPISEWNEIIYTKEVALYELKDSWKSGTLLPTADLSALQ